jgi:hypothetical protein
LCACLLTRLPGLARLSLLPALRATRTQVAGKSFHLISQALYAVNRILRILRLIRSHRLLSAAYAVAQMFQTFGQGLLGRIRVGHKSTTQPVRASLGLCLKIVAVHRA